MCIRDRREREKGERKREGEEGEEDILSTHKWHDTRGAFFIYT